MKTLILGLVAAAALIGAVPAMAQSIPVREHMQQERIAAGVRTGALTPGETARLERREVRTERVAARLRAENGGRLTRRDRHIVKHALNRDSRAIYRLKHNHRVG